MLVAPRDVDNVSSAALSSAEQKLDITMKILYYQIITVTAKMPP